MVAEKERVEKKSVGVCSFEKLHAKVRKKPVSRLNGICTDTRLWTDTEMLLCCYRDPAQQTRVVRS